MIGLEKIAEQLSARLNDNLYGYKFKVFSDSGEYAKAERENNQILEVINCLITTGNTDLTNLTDGNVIATQNYRLELLLRLENFEEIIQDEGVDLPGQEDQIREIIDGNVERIRKLRDILSSVSQQNYQDALVDEKGKTFAVTTVYQFLQSGSREQRPGIGNSLSFSMNIYAMFIENGVNTQDVKYYLDGNIIPFQSNTSYQVPTIDSYVYANTRDGRTKALASQSTLSWNFELPALNNEVTRVITDFIFNNKLNLAHVLTIEHGDKVECYFVMLGESKQNGETIKNIGQSISIFEAPNDYELVEVPSKYYVYRVDNSLGQDRKVKGFAYFIDSGKFYNGGEIESHDGEFVLTLEEQPYPIFVLERIAKDG